MNVLQVVPELNAGGVERTTIEIAEALASAGNVPHIVSKGGRMEDELRKTGAILHRLNIGSKNPLSLRTNTKALIEIIKDNNIDIVHARSRAPAWPARAAARATKRAFLTTYHGIYNAKFRLKRRYNAIMAKGDLVIANSEFTKAHIISEHSLAAEKIRVIPRGVDIERFNPQKTNLSDIKKLRSRWQADKNQKIILLPGRLTRWKGQIIAINAMAELENKNTKLVLLGDAQGREDYVTELKTLIEKLNLSNKVFIAPHTNDMPTALMVADLVISTSTDPEAFGRVMVEAQAMQKLVIASNHGGSRETVLNGKTGILVDKGETKPLARAIDELLSLNESEYKTMAKHARQRIIEKFSSNAMKEATLSVYKELLDKK